MFGTNEKYFARVMFKNKIHSLDGQSFESFFSSIMVKHNVNFELVKPYGNIGDRKNDGFDKTRGQYFQVYAPENIDRGATISDTVKKIKTDFEGLYKYWNDLCPIQEFNFVLNDKYKGAPANVHSCLLELSQKYTHISFNVFTTNKLEDIFMSLKEDSIVELIGCIADPCLQLDYSALTDVINFLMNTREDNEREEELIMADFEDKISFNNFSERMACTLKSASYQVGNLEVFFKRNSNFAKSDIQKRITDSYINAANSIDKMEERYSDLVFVKMLEDICPNKSGAVKNAALILVAYYFESCDIFEKPCKENDEDDPS